MHVCIIVLAFGWIVVLATGSPNLEICNYEHPTFSAISGPVNITILTPKTPQEVRMPNVYKNWLIADGSCVSEETGEPEFPCPVTCESEFCWLTLQIPEIKGVKKIHFISKEGNKTHQGSIFRDGSGFNARTFFEGNAPTVSCVHSETITLSWIIRRPTQNARIQCTDGGIWRQEWPFYPNELKVTYNLRHSEKNFEAIYCSVDVGRTWITANYFVIWRDTAKFIDDDENSSNGDLAIAANVSHHTLAWQVSTSEPVTSKPFVCLDNNHLICYNITLTDESEKCSIQEGVHTFHYSLAVDFPLSESTAYYCYIGEKVQAKSLLRSEVAIEEQLNAHIWYRVNGAKLRLNARETHFLQVHNLRRSDVSCRALQDSNSFSCQIEAEHLQIYWMVSVDNWLRIVRTLSPVRPATFIGSLEHCRDESFAFSIADPVYDPSEVYSLLEHTGEIDASVILRRILEGALQNQCEDFSRNQALQHQDLASVD